MRNVFDQYKHPENRLTHALVTALYEDKELLKKFLKKFCPAPVPSLKKLHIIEQGLPGKREISEDESDQRGLPDAIIHDGKEWAFLIESKIGAQLNNLQLKRHVNTLERTGFTSICGVTITLSKPHASPNGWQALTWKEIYSWASSADIKSLWATKLTSYFNIAESRMTKDSEYLTEGTLTEFSGIKFDEVEHPYTYLEGKRILKLLTEKIRANKTFIKSMNVDGGPGRGSITHEPHVWDYIRFLNKDDLDLEFNEYPHCTVGIGESNSSATITFPNKMSGKLWNKLSSLEWEEFKAEIYAAEKNLRKELRGVHGYTPMLRVVQRRYPSQKSKAIIDGTMEIDLRVICGAKRTGKYPSIKQQEDWFKAVHNLIKNRNGNMQLQIGVRFDYSRCNKIKDKDADRLFLAAWKALRQFTRHVID